MCLTSELNVFECFIKDQYKACVLLPRDDGNGQAANEPIKRQVACGMI